MKKFMFIAIVGLLFSASLACNRVIQPSCPYIPATPTFTSTYTLTFVPTATFSYTATAVPALTLTPSPTPTQSAITTPICGYTSITMPSLWGYVLTPGVTTIPTPGCSNLPAIGGINPVTFIYGGLTNPVYVIQSLTDWQNFYGCTNPQPIPPVDLNAQMIFVFEYQGCFDSLSSLNVCETQSQVMVSIQDLVHHPNCNAILMGGQFLAVAAPKSNLPINWQITVIQQ